MNLKELKEIIEMFEHANISELDLERQGARVRLRKGSSGGVGSPGTEVSVYPPAKESVSGERKAEGGKGENSVEIKSPMVGTFYRAPAPDAEPFVKEGDEIAKDQVLCIIEAMKLMNEIKSEMDGCIVKILVEAGGKE